MSLTTDTETTGHTAPVLTVGQLANADKIGTAARSDSKKKDMVSVEKKEIDPDLILSAPSKADRSKPITILSFALPSVVSDKLYDLSDIGSRIRFKALNVLPGFIVNHSSNAIGITQLVGEALYFKSSGVNKFIRDEHRGTWKAWVYPPINVVQGVFKKSAFHIDYKRLIEPKYIAEEVRRFVDLEKAAAVDYARDGKLSNRWSARSGFAGMVSMSIAAAFPDEKDDPKITEKMAIMATNHPIMYVGYRVGRGLAFPFTAAIGIVKNFLEPGVDHHVGDGKREFAGIGMTLTGLFSVLAGFRQPRQLGTMFKYDFNPWQAAGGAITTLAGTQLLLGIDNQQGWTNYGKTQFGRLLVLPMSIKERFPNKDGWGDPNAKFYFGAQGVFQVKNVVASVIGGANKLPDGTLIDQKKARAEAREKALEIKAAHSTRNSLSTGTETYPDTQAAVPATTISQTAFIEKAMPERVNEVAAAVTA